MRPPLCSRHAMTSLWFLLGLLVLGSCSDLPPLPECGRIPEGGCPYQGSATCDDSTCAETYRCVKDTWVLVASCPLRDSGLAPPIEASKPVEADSRARDAALPDGASGGPGCVELVLPDCSLGFAEACGPTCCGCEEIFVCQDRSWEPWGLCGQPDG